MKKTLGFLFSTWSFLSEYYNKGVELFRQTYGFLKVQLSLFLLNQLQEGNALNRKNNKRSAFRISIVVIPAVVIAGAGIIAFCVLQPSSHQDIACQENVARLEQLETSDISSIEKQLQELKQQNTEEALDAMQEDISSGSGSVLSDVEIRQKFQGTVIIGDSITESIMEYGFLDTE